MGRRRASYCCAGSPQSTPSRNNCVLHPHLRPLDHDLVELRKVLGVDILAVAPLDTLHDGGGAGELVQSVAVEPYDERVLAIPLDDL